MCYSLDLQAPCQQVVKLRKIKKFDPAPREDEESIALCDALIAPHKAVWQRMLETGQSTDDLWAHWMWVAEEVGLALGCLDLSSESQTALPCAPKTADRGRGTDHMLKHTTMGPSHTTRQGGPRDKLLSKIQATMGCLRDVIRWGCKVARREGGNCRATAKKPLSTLLCNTPVDVMQAWNAACRRMRKLGQAVRDDLELQDLHHLSPDPLGEVPRPIPSLTNAMRHYDKLQSLGRKLAKREATERIAKWKKKMNVAWSESPRDIYAWIKNESSAPLLMLKDPDTGEPTSNVNPMDNILHEAWDKVMRKYVDQPEPDPEIFLRKYAPFFGGGGGQRMQTTPLTGARLTKRFRKMGLRTSTGLDGWCVADLLCLPDVLLN